MKNRIQSKTALSAVAGLVFFIGFSALVYYLTNGLFSEDAVQKWIDAAGWLAPAVLILAKAATLIVVPLGGGSIYPIAGALYGFWSGLLYTLVGDLVGSAAAFLISRHLGKSAVSRLIGAWHLAEVERLYSKMGGWRGLLALRVFGFIDLVNYAAGFMPISLRAYMGVALISQIPLNFFMVSLVRLPEQSIEVKAIYVLTVLAYFGTIGIYWYYRSRHSKPKK